MSYNQKAGFLFDLDGTLIDNMSYHYQAWQQLLKTLGINWSLSEIKAQFWGKNQEIFNRLFPGRYSAAEIIELAEQKEKFYIELYKSEIE